jgi:hypothetical protein
MQDFFGNQLVVGDRVAVTPKGYKNLMAGQVVGFTEKMVRVEYAWNNGRGVTEQVLRAPTDVIKHVNALSTRQVI